jgi:hypothetical protein
VVPYFSMWARAISAKTPGKVNPTVCSSEASEQKAKYSVAASVGMLSTRSAPPTRTTSEMPEATSIIA